MSSKVAIITAAGSGMGAAIARRLASVDYKVAILLFDDSVNVVDEATSPDVSHV